MVRGETELGLAILDSWIFIRLRITFIPGEEITKHVLRYFKSIKCQFHIIIFFGLVLILHGDWNEIMSLYAFKNSVNMSKIHFLHLFTENHTSWHKIFTSSYWQRPPFLALLKLKLPFYFNFYMEIPPAKFILMKPLYLKTPHSKNAWYINMLKNTSLYTDRQIHLYKKNGDN